MMPNNSWEDYRDAAKQLLAKGDVAEAQSMLELALGEAEQFGPNDVRVGVVLTDLAEAARDLGNDEEALALLLRAKEIVKANEDAENEDRGLVYLYLGDALRRLGRLKEAGEEYREALIPLRAVADPLFPHALICQVQLAEVTFELGDSEEGERLLADLINQVEQRPDLAPPDKSLLYSLAAGLSMDRGHLVQAELLYRKALVIQTEGGFEDSLETADNWSDMGRLYSTVEKWDLALEAHERALEIRKRHLPPADPDIARALGNLAVTFTGLGKFDKAEDLAKRALEIAEGATQPDPEHVYDIMDLLASILAEAHKFDELEALVARQATLFSSDAEE